MKNKNFGFTLIELLVVIVIIGILATISTATFSGYFKKSRDTERQSFVRNAQQIIIASTVAQDTPDYRMGGTDAATVEAAVKAALDDQGYAVPATKNAINYYYVINSATLASVAAADFMVFACKEDSLPASGNNTGAAIADFAFIAGTDDTLLTLVQAQAACNATPADPAVTGGSVINLAA